MVPIDVSLLNAIAVAFFFFVLSQLGIGFFREIGSKTANRALPRSDSSPQTFVEGEDFELRVGNDGEVDISLTNSGIGSDDGQMLEDSKKIIVEGVTDRQILKSVLAYLCEFPTGLGYPCDASIIVAEGAANIPNLMDWAQKTGEEYSVIVDNDFGTEHVFEDLPDDVNAGNIIVVGQISGKESATTLLDLFSSDFVEDCILSATGRSVSIDSDASASTEPKDLRKVLEEITTRLTENRDVSLEDVRHFHPLLWEISER